MIFKLKNKILNESENQDYIPEGQMWRKKITYNQEHFSSAPVRNIGAVQSALVEAPGVIIKY